MHYPRVLITGNSSGLGLSLTGKLLEHGSEVYGLSRRGCPLTHEGLHDIHCDLADRHAIQPALDKLLADVSSLDLVVLNAGTLGKIQALHETPLESLDEIMQINVWANKTLIDSLITRSIHCRQIVLISSGAGVRGNAGWGGYALSKAALNMLTQLYAHELPETQINALAPGLMDTAMQDYLCGEADSGQFPSLQRLKAARGTDNMPDADGAAGILLSRFPDLLQEPTGSFRDIRTWPQP
ncbi:SDR family NAD(P)-dependent oxidoreductase [Granulosicoccaceae sp. 1_MG-2023]|nr:SDR family NAD(P)-dependent oxidoreductase [Granulosicoccaceae sp. 1_MG-2023]